LQWIARSDSPRKLSQLSQRQEPNSAKEELVMWCTSVLMLGE